MKAGKNRFARLLALALLVLMLCGAVLGCSGGAAQPTPTAQPVEEAQPTMEAQPTPEAPAPTPQAQPTEEPLGEHRPSSPLLWQVKDGDATLYLFGSIHAAPPELYPLGDTIMNAFNASDFLAVECDMLAYQADMEAQMRSLPYMMYTDGTTKVTDVIDEALFTKVAELLTQEQAGLDPEMLDQFTPYMLMSLLQSISMEKAGLSAQHGLDLHLLSLAKEQGKEVLEVESVEAQLQLLNGFSPEVHTFILESYLDMELATEQLVELYNAWEAGDEAKLMALTLADEENHEASAEAMEYYEQLGPVRNVTMADAAEQYLKDGKNVFYTVGAMHMIGEDGIVALLEQKGYTVTQVG